MSRQERQDEQRSGQAHGGGGEAARMQPRHERIAPEGLDAWRESFRVLQSHEIWKVYGDFVTSNNPALGPGVKERFEFARSVTDQDAARANEVRRRARERTAGVIRPGTIFVLPTSPAIAPLASSTPEQLEAFRVRALRMTSIAGLSGLPQVSIPIGTVSGCPAGLSFIGWRGGFEPLLKVLLQIGHLFERRRCRIKFLIRNV